MRRFPERLYETLPITAQQTICSLEGWRVNRKRYDTRFLSILRSAEERSGWSNANVATYRDLRLLEFIRTAVSKSRHYDGPSYPLNDIKNLHDLKNLPILTKTEVQNALDAIEVRDRQDQMNVHTSGTTGAGLRFVSSTQAVQEQWAVWWRYRRWHGIKLGTWCGYFGGRPIVPIDQKSGPWWRYNRPGRQIIFSGYHMSPDRLNEYVIELRRSKPPWLHGYPSLLSLLANFLLDRNDDLGYPLRWVTTGAENLLPHQREVISQAFGVLPRQHYGSAEAVANISECDRGSLHVDEDFSATEFIPVDIGPSCRIVGTNFTNPLFPLMRYDTGDLATISDDECLCGRPGRIIEELDGRNDDYVVLPDGSLVGRLDHIFKDLVHIRESQIYQTERTSITILVVPGPRYDTDHEERLLQEARNRLGTSLQINIERVADLQRSARGKLRLVVSELEEGQLSH